MDGVRGVLFDIDGVLTVSWKPLPGAAEAVRAVRDTGALLLGLERAADVEATVVGKPAGAFFDVALHMLGVDGVDGDRPQHVLDSVADLAELLGLPDAAS